MANAFDQLGKKIGLRALRPSGATTAQYEIASNARHADLLHDPDPAQQAEREKLGLLGRMAEVVCLIEIFSRAPGEDEVIDCLGKLIAFRQERRRARDARPSPFLWIITAGRPSTVLSGLGAEPLGGWPPGVYVTPGRQLDAGAGPPEMGSLLRTGVVVANELPRDRSTILVRIMAGGAALPAALTDLAALPLGAYEREVASSDVLELRRALGGKPARTIDEEEFIVITRDAFDDLLDYMREEARKESRLLGLAEGRREGLAEGHREGLAEGHREGLAEGHREGLAEGRREGAARALLTALRARRIAVPEAVRARILAEPDPERLERWVERAVVATSLSEVLDEPS